MRTVIVLLACLVGWVEVAVAAPASNALSASAARAEIRALYSGLRSAHYDLFAQTTEAEYSAFVAREEDAIHGPVSRQDLAITLQKITAFGHVGHARLDAPTHNAVAAFAQGARFIPLFIRVDGDKVILVETADRQGRFQAGSELIALNGEPVGQWLERLSRYVSAERAYMAHTLMEQSFPILLGFELGDVEGVTVRVRDQQGEPITGELRAITLAERAAIRASYPAPALAVNFSSRSFQILPDRIGYLRPGPFMEASGTGADPNYDVSAFATFVDDAFQQAIGAGIPDLIIDLRNNPGGDNSFSDHMVAWFADRPFRFASSFTLRASAESKAWYQRRQAQVQADDTLRALADAEAAQANGTRYAYPLPWVEPRQGQRYSGRIHVLVNRHSYSNAASTAAMIQDYGFGRILGEETADVPTTYASVLNFELPETGFLVTYPKSRIVRPNGDETVRGVVPDIAIDRPRPDARDVVLDRALSLVLQDRDRSPR